MQRKIILAIADGLGDRPISSLEGKTPLEYAQTPTLDQMANEGSTGIVDILGAGIPVGTDLGHMILFGYGLNDYPGRGPIEASGAGLLLKPGDVAFRANFATVDDNLLVIDRRAGRIREKTAQLASAIHGLRIEDVDILFKEATEHRAVLILRGDHLSDQITDSDPKIIHGPTPYRQVKPIIQEASAEKTARILNKLLLIIHGVLKNHPLNIERAQQGLLPANFLLTRGAGMVPTIPKITDIYGFKGACVAAEGTVLGVTRIAGFTPLTHESLTGNIDTNIEKKAALVLEAIETNDFVAMNFKAPDLMGHDNNPLGKVRAIERFDALMKLILAKLPDHTIIAVTADHSTPCERREHSGDPVPLLLFGPGIRKDTSRAFDESAASQGGLGRIKGYELVNTLYDFMERTKKQGN